MLFGLPMLACLAVHYRAFKMWFGNDDFAWLGLRLMVSTPRDLLTVLFTPMAQGTVRVFSERLYFLCFSSIFGLDPLPFRIWVFLTQFANIALLAWIARRMTGSTLAGILAPILWSANCGLALAMSWSSSYNEICFAFFFLLSFFLLLKYIDTGRLLYWIALWIAFVLGFGALELMVMYPAIAAAYTFCCARKHFRETLWLFLPSVIFTAVHFGFIPSPTDPAYQMHFDGAIFATVLNYWRLAVSASRPTVVDSRPVWLGLAGAIVISAALVGFAAYKLRRREWLAGFLTAWFFIVLAPVAPLRNHFTEYYVTVPVIGLAILAAWGMAEAAKSGPAMRVAGSAAIVFYLAVSMIDIATVDNYFYNRYRKMHRLIDGLIAVQNTKPAPVIMLSGVGDDFFWSGFYDDPFRLIGIEKIYLTPGTESVISPHPEWGGISRFLISLDDAVQALKQKRAEVYTLEDDRLRRITDIIRPYLYRQYIGEHPNVVDVGDPLFQDHLGSTWYRIENAFRWMPKSATVRIGGPRSASDMLYVTGFCPPGLLAKGPVEVTFRADGRILGTETMSKAAEFRLQLGLPVELVGKQAIEISIDLNRTVEIPPDVRPLGLIFGTFTIK